MVGWEAYFLRRKWYSSISIDVIWKYNMGKGVWCFDRLTVTLNYGRKSICTCIYCFKILEIYKAGDLCPTFALVSPLLKISNHWSLCRYKIQTCCLIYTKYLSLWLPHVLLKDFWQWYMVIVMTNFWHCWFSWHIKSNSMWRKYKDSAHEWMNERIW
jgi:hypothetical protein